MKIQDLEYPHENWNPEDKNLLNRHILMYETINNLKWGKNKKSKIEDLTKCWIWEIARTQIYDSPYNLEIILDSKQRVDKHLEDIRKHRGDQEKIDSLKDAWFSKERTYLDAVIESTFPYYVETFPQKSYLSHTKATREKWTFKNSPPEETHNDLFTCRLFLPDEKQGWIHFLQTNLNKPVFSTNSDNVYVTQNGLTKNPYKQESSSVPMIFNIGINWDKTRLKKAIDEQWEEIENERNKLVENYKSLGANFSENKKVRIDEKLKPALIQLGAYRWLHHSKLTWNHIEKFRKKKLLPHDFPYSTKAKLRESILEQKNTLFFPKFNFEKEGENPTNYLLRTLYDS